MYRLHRDAELMGLLGWQEHKAGGLSASSGLEHRGLCVNKGYIGTMQYIGACREN